MLRQKVLVLAETEIWEGEADQPAAEVVCVVD